MKVNRVKYRQLLGWEGERVPWWKERKALVEHGLPDRSELIRECGYSKQDAYRATRELLALHSPPTAIFAANDYMALGARKAICNFGLRIPADVARGGFDDIEATSLRGVEITTISQKKYEMGALAVDCLVERIEGKRHLAKQIVLRPEVIIRRSCGFLGSTDGTVPEPVFQLKASI